MALTALIAFALVGSACDGCSSDKEALDEGAIALGDPAPAGVEEGEEPNKAAAAKEGPAAAAKRLAERNAGKRVGPSVVNKGLADKARRASKVIPNSRSKPTKVANPKLAERAALANKRLAGQTGTKAAAKREGIAAKAKEGTSVKGPNTGRTATPASTKKPAKTAESARAASNNTKIDTPLPIDQYLPLRKVRELTGQLRMASVGPVPGIKPTPRYNSSLYMPPGRTPTFGVGLQVWREPTRRDVNNRYLRMKGQYTNAEETQALAPDKAFFAYYGNIMSLTFMSFGKKRVVSVSCGETVCDQKKLLDLTQATQKSL